jgi:uncharacterized membrane-anchored protein YitT (DUF2179 family)
MANRGGSTMLDVAEEFGYWFLFSVMISLAQLWLVVFAYYAMRKQFTWMELIGNGSLLFFATTMASKTAGEYFRKVKPRKRNGVATLVCLFAMIAIIFPSVFIYALITAIRVGMMSGNMLAPDRVTFISDVLALAALLFSLGFTFVIRYGG